MLFTFLMIELLSGSGLNLNAILTCISFITEGIENLSNIYWLPFLFVLMIVGSYHFLTIWFNSWLNAFWIYYIFNLCGIYQHLQSIQVKKTINFIIENWHHHNLQFCLSLQYAYIALEFLSYIDISVTCATGTSFKNDVLIKVLL
jgi:hypothetical protein